MRSRVVATLAISAFIAAEDIAVPEPVVVEPAAEPAPAPVPRWKTVGAAGLFGSSVVSSNADESRDPAIAGTSETVAWRASLEAGLDFRDGKHAADHRLVGKYGRSKAENRDWIEDTDEVRYDGVYRYLFHKPHFTYLDWGWESVFTGPLPDERAFDPGLVKAGIGYGQLYENLLPLSDKLEGRIGAAARKRYGQDLSASDTETQIGLALFLRYERKQSEALRYYAQYEGFAEFEDFTHLSNLITAGLKAQLARYLTCELGLRAWYETSPDDVADDAPGFDDWSLRQDTLLGLTYAW